MARQAGRGSERPVQATTVDVWRCGGRRGLYEQIPFGSGEASLGKAGLARSVNAQYGRTEQGRQGQVRIVAACTGADQIGKAGMVQNEIRLHAAALRLLRVACPDCITFHIPNGGKRSPETARLMKALGTTAGIFDLCLIDPVGRLFFLEAKTDKGRLSEAQEWFRKELIVRGVPYVIFRNLDDVRDFILVNNIPNRLAQ